MNSVVERQWQNMSQIMRTLLVHARLSNHFYHFAGKYAKDILNILPTKNILDHEGNPTTPHFKALQTKPKIGNFRVFGCPASFKRYNATSHRTQTQQASRGIFVGFPNHQAGWLFYTEQHIGSTHIHVSRDATFEENFDSALVFDKHPFQGSLAYRHTPAANEMQTFNNQTTDQSTGSVADFTTLPQDQSEEGNEPDESSASENENENPETEPLEIENSNEMKYDNESEIVLKNETNNTSENRYPDRK